MYKWQANKEEELMACNNEINMHLQSQHHSTYRGEYTDVKIYQTAQCIFFTGYAT